MAMSKQGTLTQWNFNENTFTSVSMTSKWESVIRSWVFATNFCSVKERKKSPNT